MNKPLVSVIIPYYNKIDFFKKTYISVINQDYKNFEVIIVYDDEDKKDLEILKKIIKKKTKIIINKKNLGAGFSRNKGIKISRGKYIAFIDSDDIWYKNKLKTHVNLMERKNLMFTHSSYKINYQNKIIGKRNAKKELKFKQLLNSCDIGLSTVVLNKKILNKLKFPNIKTKEDFVLWLKISLKYEIIGINKYLVLWRKTENSLSSNILQKLIDGYKVYRIYMGFSIFKSIIYLIKLSINFFLKN